MRQNDFDQLLSNLNERNLQDYARTHLSKDKQKKLQEILADPARLDALMKSDKARQIMEMLKKKDNH